MVQTICGKFSRSRKMSREDIATKVIEPFVTGNLSIQEIAIITGLWETTIIRYMNTYYFPYRGDNKETLTLKSNI